MVEEFINVGIVDLNTVLNFEIGETIWQSSRNVVVTRPPHAACNSEMRFSVMVAAIPAAKPDYLSKRKTLC